VTDAGIQSGGAVRRKVFPHQEVQRILETWWDDEVDDDPFADNSKKGTLYELLPTVDSLTILNLLLTVEMHLNIKLPVSVVRRGGYKSKKDMVDHLLPRIRRHFESKSK
jgi:hypothetical protein